MLREYISKNSEAAERWISRAEIVALLFTLIGIFMIIRGSGGASIFLVIGLSFLAFVYMMFGMFLTEIFHLQKKFFFRYILPATYIALSVTTIGILFRLNEWPGAGFMIQIGGILTVVLFVILMYQLFFGKIEKDEHRSVINNLIVRMLPALIIMGFLIVIGLNKM